jgi:hypothetical protein
LNVKNNLLFADLVHPVVVLVTNAVVNALQKHIRQEAGDRILGSFVTVSGEESTPVVASLNKSMSGLTIGLDSGDSDLSVLVLEGPGVRDDLGAVAHGSVEDSIDGVDLEGNVLDTVAVLLQVMVNLSQFLLFLIRETVKLVERAERGSENEGDVSIADDVRADSTMASFEATVSNAFEAHTSDVV